MSEYEHPKLVIAQYDSECDGCLGSISEGEPIRSDNRGGWLCIMCILDEDTPPPRPVQDLSVNWRDGM